MAAGTATFGVVARASSQLVTVGITLFAVQFLAPAEFGSFAIASAFLILTRNFLYTGPFEYLLKNPNPVRVAYGCLAANVIITILTCAISVPVAYAITQYSGDRSVLVLLLLIIPTCFISCYLAWLESLIFRSNKLRSYYAATLTSEVIGGMIAVLCFLGGLGLMALVVHMYVRVLALAILYRIIERPPAYAGIGWSILKDITFWSRDRYAATTALFGANYAGDMILGAFYSPSAAGLYRASNRIVTAASDVFAQPLRTMAQAKISRAFARGDAASDEGLYMLSAFAWVAWPALASLALLSGYVTRLMLGPEWAGTAPIIAIFCVARGLSIFDSASTATLVAYDRQRNLLWYLILYAVLSVAGIFAFLQFGVVAASLAVLFATVINSSLIAWDSYRIGGLTTTSVLFIARLPLLATLLTALPVSAAMSFGQLEGWSDLVTFLAAVGAGAVGWSAAVLLSLTPLRRAVSSLSN